MKSIMWGSGTHPEHEHTHNSHTTYTTSLSHRQLMSMEHGSDPIDVVIYATRTDACESTRKTLRYGKEKVYYVVDLFLPPPLAVFHFP
eukprot:m.269753 g.269753  ORF g.269753 m.269753 type:complete len:88 (-) comp86103_c0_seq1:2-265(-)